MKKSGLIAKTLQKLPAAPGLSEIHHFLSLAMEQKGKQVEITWPTPDKLVEFALNIQCPARGGDTRWRLFSGQGAKWELLWDYQSCDVLLVYNLIVSSAGEVHQSVRADGAITVSESYRDASRRRDTYYMQAVQPSDLEKARLASLGLQDNSWSKATAELTGEFALVQPTALYQSILLSKMTGCLKIDRGTQHASIYFVQGEPVFAESNQLAGDECIVETVNWRDGRYNFEPRARTDKANVSTPLETLVVKGVQLGDHLNYLRHAGVAPESVLVKKRRDLTDFELSASIAGDAKIDSDALILFFNSIDDRSTIKQMTKRLNMPRSVWAPIVCHLVERDYVSFSNDLVAPTTDRGNLQAKVIDTSLIHSVMMSLRRAETGMFTYPAFLYFLEQEYFRAYRSGSPLSVIVMEMRVVLDGMGLRREPLDVEAVAEAFRRISRLKRNVDLLAHYENFDYAMILPNTRNQGANIFAKRIIKALTNGPLAGVPADRLSLAFGIASIPDDCTDLGLLLSAAESAKAYALRSAAPVVAYQDTL